VNRAKLVDAASELNKVLGLDPEIDTSAETSELKTKVAEAAALASEDDDLSDETKAVINQLTKASATTDDGGATTDGATEGAPKKARRARKPRAEGESKVPGLRGRYKGSLKEYADNLMLREGGITWEELLAQTKPEAEKRGMKSLSRLGQLKRLAKRRIKQGYQVDMDDERVKMHPRSA
jgi:hypothetical protein